MSTIGHRLRESRTRRVLTQQELAELCGVREVTISRIENDHVAELPRPSTIRKLAAALYIDAGWLMTGERSEKSGKGEAQ